MAEPAATSRQSEVDVFVQVGGDDLHAGRLISHFGRGTESATFLYDPGYISDPRAYDLDPALPKVSGSLHTPVGVSMFPAFADSSPDRWGRRLIERAERLRAERESTTARRLSQFSYLLGVRDDLRQGALRFALPGSHTYLADDDSGVPAVVDLPELMDLAERSERDDAGVEELRRLLRAGSSLGGARPKSHVRTDDGRVAIAKFPSAATDTWNVMAWERIASSLAEQAGVIVPRSQLLTIGGRDVHIIDRFDRDGPVRIGYVSAMTMLEARDGDTGSYLDIAAVIEEKSAEATVELHQLWRRIAFSVLISNTDDHLRNHGFLSRWPGVWSLSPAFDVNPDPSPGRKYLATAINESDTEADIDLVLDVADLFRLNRDQALETLAEISAVTSKWAQVAASFGQTRSQIDRMAPAFEHEQARKTEALTK